MLLLILGTCATWASTKCVPIGDVTELNYRFHVHTANNPNNVHSIMALIANTYHIYNCALPFSVSVYHSIYATSLKILRSNWALQLFCTLYVRLTSNRNAVNWSIEFYLYRFTFMLLFMPFRPKTYANICIRCLYIGKQAEISLYFCHPQW